jgi:preprotein translocase subunit SecD
MEKATRVWSSAVLVVCCSMIGCQPSPAPLGEVPFPVDRIELRPAETEAGDGLEEAVDRSTSKSVFLHPPAKGLQGAEDIAKATIRIFPDESWLPVLHMELTEAGHQKMEQINKKHGGKPLAALIDGKVRVTAPVRGASDTEVAIAGVFTREEALQLKNESKK